MTEQAETCADRPTGAEAADGVLDRGIWESLRGHHARFAERHGLAVRYQPDVAPFVAFEDYRDPRAWADAAELIGPEGSMAVHGVPEWPEDWESIFHAEGVQMTGVGMAARPDPEAVVLGSDDIPEILDLVARTKPGPFLPGTIELGTYLGIRRDGALVAMAGERLRPAGWTEISAVCTDPAYRGQGLAGRLISAVAARILQYGETPYLHARGDNANAIRLYETLGFRVRRSLTFTVLVRSR
jgi:ribosomal protein S18 acetylase RimI-like enzyme